MREEISFRVFFEKVRATTRKLEIDNAKLPRQRIISCENYKEGEASVEFASTVEERYR